MRKMLMLASVASMIDQFNMPNIKLLSEMEYEVHVGCNFKKGNTCPEEKIEELKKTLEKMQIRYFQIDFSRNVFKINEILKSYKQVKSLMEKEQYEFIHCHSPIGGVVGRIAGHATGTKVIYTAHGFHFYKGAPLLNWILYYPVEKWLSKYTDILITINKEDYKRAKEKFHAKRIEYVPGVGIDVEKIQAVQVDREAKRRELGIGKDDFLLLSVGELNKNKNHEVVIRAIAELKNPKIKYAICGKGSLKEYLEELAVKLGVRNQLFLLGFRTDVIEICKSADVFVFPSKREGLSVALMEAMACGLPCVVSKIRGNVDLIDEKKGGVFFGKRRPKDSLYNFLGLFDNIAACQRMGVHNVEKIINFDKQKIEEKMKQIYLRKDKGL